MVTENLFSVVYFAHGKGLAYQHIQHHLSILSYNPVATCNKRFVILQ